MENKLSHNGDVVMEMVEAIIDNNSNENNLDSSMSQNENAHRHQESSQDEEKRGKKIQIYSRVNLKI